MAESDPSTQSGSDVDQPDSDHYTPKKYERPPKSRLLGSVRALAIKKVSSQYVPNPTHCMLQCK